MTDTPASPNGAIYVRGEAETFVLVTPEVLKKYDRHILEKDIQIQEGKGDDPILSVEFNFMALNATVAMFLNDKQRQAIAERITDTPTDLLEFVKANSTVQYFLRHASNGTVNIFGSCIAVADKRLMVNWDQTANAITDARWMRATAKQNSEGFLVLLPNQLTFSSLPSTQELAIVQGDSIIKMPITIHGEFEKMGFLPTNRATLWVAAGQPMTSREQALVYMGVTAVKEFSGQRPSGIRSVEPQETLKT